MRILAASEIYPVRPVYAWDESLSLGADNSYFTTDDGFYLYESQTMNKTVDLKMNRNTAIQLLSASDISEIVVDEPITTGVVGNYMIYVSDISSTTDLQFALAADVSGQMRVTDDMDSDQDEICYFTVTTFGDKVEIRRGTDGFTSVDGFISLQSFNGADDQRFELDYAGNGWYRLISFDSEIVRISDSPSEYFYFAFTKDGITGSTISEISLSGFTASNKWVQYSNVYKPDYSSDPSILTPDESKTISGIDLNYMLLSPYYSIRVDSETRDAILPYDIVPVKNFKSINSDQMLIPTVERSSESINFRQYERIYSGASQLAGYPEIHLGYRSNYGTIINLYPDKYTYFHLPQTSDEYLLSGTNLRSIGAVAGAAPAYSDRIYKKLSNYGDNIWWGGDETQINNGIWLCAWLSGNAVDSVWMERYYDAGKISYSAAMTVSGYGGNSFIPISGDVIWDIPSQMKLTPGSYYKYFHAGKDTLTERVEKIFGNNGERIIFKLNDFVQDSSTVEDSSANKFIGALSFPTVSNVEKLSISVQSEIIPAILFKSNQNEITIPASPAFNTPKTRTTMGWFYLDDWSNEQSAIQSEAIYSNYYKGGDKLEYINHGVYYSSILPTPSEGKVAVLPANSNNAIITQINPQLSGMSTAVDLDGNLYVCGHFGTDTEIFKLAPDGTPIINVEYPSVIFKQIIIKDDNIGYVQDSNSNTKWELNLHSLSLGASSYSPNSQTLFLQTDGDVTSIPYAIFDIFSDGLQCYFDGANIRIGGNIIDNPQNLNTLSALYCDDDTYLYATYVDTDNKYSLGVYNRTTGTWVQKITKSTYSPTPSTINQVFITKERLNNRVQNIIYWIIGTGMVYKYYMSSNDVLSLISEIDISGNTPISINASDFSGFKLNKVHNDLNGNVPLLKYSVLINEDNPVKKTVYTSPIGYSNSWHHIVSVKGESSIELYVDGELKDSSAISGDMIYNFGSIYNIGGGIIGKNTISTALSSDNRLNMGVSDFITSNGIVSDITVLAKYDLYFATDIPLQWPVRTQPRNFVERIKSFNKFKIPGRKSQFYNIVVRNLDITDEEKAEYEQVIRKTAEESTPDYLKLKDIIWK